MSLFHIGATKESIAAARAAILEIVKTPADPTVSVEALRTLSSLCHVGPTTITHCTFTADKLTRRKK